VFLQHTIVLVCFGLIKISHLFLVFYCILHLSFTCTTLWSSCSFAAVPLYWNFACFQAFFHENLILNSNIQIEPRPSEWGASWSSGGYWLVMCGGGVAIMDVSVIEVLCDSLWAFRLSGLPHFQYPWQICSRLVHLYHTGHHHNWTVKTLKFFWHECNQNHLIKVKIFCSLKPLNIILDFILQL
jgi:hypothetical protein